MARKDKIEEALAVSGNRDWSGATVEHAPREPMVVESVRLPREMRRWLEEIADRNGVNPSVMIRNIIAAAWKEDTAGENAMVRVSDVRRAIATIAQQQAA